MIQASSIGSSDIVLEIGAGRGIITTELARVAGRVIAVEVDPSLAQELRWEFTNTGNVEIVAKDFLTYQVCQKEYKVFANIPYNCTADILRKLLYGSPAPTEAWLILQKEAAEKISGCPRETQFSVLAKPWFDFRILRALRRTDFHPIPAVDSVLLHIRKRSTPLIGEGEGDSYRRFIQYGFGRWRKSLKCIFKTVFTYRQWKQLAHDLGFALDATPTELSFEQWLGLFKFYKNQPGMSGRL